MSNLGVRERVAAVPRETRLVVGLISGSQFFNHAFLVLLPPIFTVLEGDLGVSIAMLGTVLGVQALVNTVFTVPYGYLADHYDRTLALGLSSVVGAAGAIVTALAPGLWVLLAGQVLIGIGVGGHHPAHYPLLTDATSEEAHGRAFAVYNLGGSLGFATPPVVISAFVAAGGFSWRHGVGLLGVVGLVYGLACTALVAWRVGADITGPSADGDARTAPLRERVRSELRTLIAEPGILAMTALALFSSTANWGLTAYAVVFLTTVYDLSLGLANLALTGVFVVGAGAVLAGGWLTDRVDGTYVLVGSVAGYTVLVAAIAVGVVPGLVAVGLFLLVGGVRSMAGPARDQLTQRLSTSEAVAKSFAIVTIGTMLGSAIAPPVFGYATTLFGARAAFVGIAIVGGATTVVAVLVVRMLDQ